MRRRLSQWRATISTAHTARAATTSAGDPSAAAATGRTAAATTEPSDTVRLTATVIDPDGNRLPNVLVLFSAEAGTLRSRGTGVRTDSRGIATDSLTITPTDAAVAGADGSISVTAQATSGGQTVNATKSIFVFAAPTPTPRPA